MYDNGQGKLPQCPSEEPTCDTDSHFCQEETEGHILLTEMQFTSAGCDGCATEGVNLFLTGNTLVAPPPQCRTVNLDHPSTPDYVSEGIFKAISAEHDAGWDSCYRVI